MAERTLVLHKFLIHRKGDHVGVAIEDITAGERVEGVCLDESEATRVTTNQAVPLGHKVALVDLKEGGEVIEYGVRVGIAKSPIKTGDLVHTHNIRSARWYKK